MATKEHPMYASRVNFDLTCTCTPAVLMGVLQQVLYNKQQTHEDRSCETAMPAGSSATRKVDIVKMLSGLVIE